jgi:type III restriction enzyme
MLKLKPYQERALAALRAYLEAARVNGPEKAFAAVSGDESPARSPYRSIDGLEPVPYVCLRLPTGGGKTILASYVIDVAAKSYLEQEFPVVLWLVPTNAIRRQTLDALKKPGHAYRQAIDDAFDGRVSVFDIGEVEQIRPQDMRDRVCLIVGTLAALRVDKTEGRKIYAHNENFEPHFARIPHVSGLERIEEGPDQGKIKFSFANLLHLHRPLVIMDEAHNARTPLTFEVLQRVAPACIVEFTATPDRSAKSGSNVLFHVSASELKAEEMIKLPIILTEHANWQQAIHDAILTRRRLGEHAAAESDFIRPLVLIQAESKNREATVEVIRKHLVDVEKIEESRVAVATGDQRELDGIDLFDPACRIEYIITMEALKEGWDCSFAYVFCSVANIHSGKDVEQILGRVLRMPYAKKRTHAELNRAYAHVSSPSFAQAAVALRDHLVDMGFDEVEADTFVKQGQSSILPDECGLPLFAGQSREPLTLLLDEAPDLSFLTVQDNNAVTVAHHASGQFEVTIRSEVTDEIEQKLIDALPVGRREEIKKILRAHREYQERRLSPAEKGEKLNVPRLCVRVQGELELVEKELFLDHAGWNLLDYPANFISNAYSLSEEKRIFEFDVSEKRLVWRTISENEELNLDHLRTHWTELQLVRWLDREVHQPYVRQEVLLEFIRRFVQTLIEEHKLDLTTLVRNRFTLVKVLIEKIKEYRQQAYDSGYQEVLFGPSAAVETSYRFAFAFDPENYPARDWYRPGYQFQNHFYRAVGELDAVGEEFECAQALDRLPQVKYWVRNLAKAEQSFWLPTSTDRFYPDFVAELKDGRIFVVEYKGKIYMTNDDSKEKRNLGELWEEKSQGKGLFLMAEKRDTRGRGVHEQLLNKVSSGTT